MMNQSSVKSALYRCKSDVMTWTRPRQQIQILLFQTIHDGSEKQPKVAASPATWLAGCSSAAIGLFSSPKWIQMQQAEKTPPPTLKRILKQYNTQGGDIQSGEGFKKETDNIVTGRTKPEWTALWHVLPNGKHILRHDKTYGLCDET